MSERLTLPVLPLRDMVLFPGVTAPIGAGRPATLRAIEAALKHPSRRVFAVAQRENVDAVTPASLYGMGTIARIGQVQRGLGGLPRGESARAPGAARDPRSRGAIAAGAGPHPAPDRCHRRSGGDQVAGPGGAGRAAA